jgi:hypothetical protein
VRIERARLPQAAGGRLSSATSIADADKDGFDLSDNMLGSVRRVERSSGGMPHLRASGTSNAVLYIIDLIK